MRWWSDFDDSEVATDFARIASSGLDSVRLFLTWEDFQPVPDQVDIRMLDRLVTVLDLANGEGLAVMPTLFTGHMSGVNWIPAWALGGTDGDDRFRVVSGGEVTAAGLRNWYQDADIARAQSLLAGETAGALAGHDAICAWDLGNENSNCVLPSNRHLARDWLQRITTAIRAADESVLITVGLHMEDLEENRLLGPREASDVCDFLTMHGYPIYAHWAEGPADEHVLPFLAHMTRWLGKDETSSFRSLACLPAAVGTGKATEAVAQTNRYSLGSRPRPATRIGRWPLCIEPAASARRCGAARTTSRPSGTVLRSTPPRTSAPSGCGERTGRPSHR